MSGINELKKKAKMSIDEMYDNQSVGKEDNQKSENPESKKTTPTNNQAFINPAITPTLQKPNFSDDQIIGQATINPSDKMENLSNEIPDTQQTRQQTIFPVKQSHNQKVPTYKMTFNLTEQIYKAFNDLYAHRILQGRKTDKSEIICEAIQWLIKMEEEIT